MTSDWAKLATELKGFVKVAKIDASKYPQFDEMYGLKGFPHIVFIPGGINISNSKGQNQNKFSMFIKVKELHKPSSVGLLKR